MLHAPSIVRTCGHTSRIGAVRERGEAMRRASFGVLSGLLLIFSLGAYASVPVQSASGYANPAFEQQWQQGEANTGNFWGPLGTAKDGQQEPYQEAGGGTRLVQYFDKGRMELTNGAVTNGLLASEIVRGQVQVGDGMYQSRPAPAIPIAGDNDNPGPTYAQLGTTAASLLAPANVAARMGVIGIPTVLTDGTVQTGDASPAMASFAAFDLGTRHNVPDVFSDYRQRAGLAAIGFAISEPFAASVKVAGQQKSVLIQVFERRVLTFTPDNPPAFQVEMGNIGQHYYQWRYTGAPVGNGAGSGQSQAPTVAPAIATPTPQAVSMPATARPVTLPPAFSGPPPTVAPTLPVATTSPRLMAPGAMPPLGDFPPPPPYTGPMYRCADFPSQAAAQAFLRLFPTDPTGLDPGRTGIACATNPAPFNRDSVTRK